MGNVTLTPGITEKGLFLFFCSKQHKKTEITPAFLQLLSNVK